MKLSIFDYAAYRGWYGLDANPQISLLEYRLLVREKINVVQIICAHDYIVDTEHPRHYTIDRLEKCELDNFFEENSWADKDGVFDFADIKGDKSWRRLDYLNKIDILISYYGFQNIIGDYYPHRDGRTLLQCLNIADGFPPKFSMGVSVLDGENWQESYLDTRYGSFVAIVSHQVDEDGDFWYAHAPALGSYTYYGVGKTKAEAIKSLRETIETLAKDEQKQ